ncbi:MAG: acetate kinase [Candidatus Aureabacteria bacterium]|nr:acetate kinase [Candidatus Auribacterota bacterium]
MIILCLNCGSSSVKYRLYNWDERRTLAAGIVERIGIKDSFCEQEVAGKEHIRIPQDCQDHRQALQLAVSTMTHPRYGVIKDMSCISAVGHRVVHGGEKFAKSVIITPEIYKTFEDLSDLAPLHNPPNLMGIKAAQEFMPDIPHMAIMDTAWHQTMPEHVYTYALPYEWYTKYGVRRYGFHGTSFLYVAKRAAVLLEKNPFECNLVICHIGNGASVNAVKNGVSYDTSMGFTPLEGMMMGTRCGDHDTAIDFFIMQKENKSPQEMNSILNKKSGLLGITGKTDMRDIQDAVDRNDDMASLALEMECYRIKKYLGSYCFAVGGAHAIVFTAGIGEMSDIVREKSLQGLESLGIVFDPEKNRIAKTRNSESEISAKNSKVKIFVVPTDEERVLIEDVVHLLDGTYQIHTQFTYRFQDPEYMNTLRCLEFAEECQKKPELLGIMPLIYKKAFLKEVKKQEGLKKRIQQIPDVQKYLPGIEKELN